MDVLVYVDPSPRGEWALSLAAQLPPAWATRLHLLATSEDAAAEPDMLARARGRLAAAANVTVGTREGPAERALIAEARAQPWGLVVVPPAGRGAVVRILRGSRVATVVRSVEAPVLVARRPPALVERVLAAVSGGESTDAVVDAAIQWQTHASARVSFLHVSAEVALPSEPRRPGPGGPTALERIRSALDRRGRAEAVAVRDGLVVEEVLDAFETDAHHLLVIGARGEDDIGFGREDVTERLLLRCPASTLIVPRGLAPSAR